jgi:hypothetical protein
VAHRQFGKNVAALRHVDDAGLKELAWRPSGDFSTFETDCTARQIEQAEDRFEDS